MRGTAALLGAIVLAGSTPVGAEIYRWTDEQGELHFTQSLDQVPPRHRAAAKAEAEAARPGRLQRYPTASPPASASRHARSLQIPFRRHGTLMLVDVRLNDSVEAPFYVDTGASGISLPAPVAERLGLGAGPETPHVYVRTANGVASHALVNLDSVEVAGARVEGLEATVNPSMEVGLLGGAFFNHFVYQVDAAAGVITLAENPDLRGGVGAEEWRERFRRVREPLGRLESHLETSALAGPGRREELETRRTELERSLEALEREANRLGVPAAWRE